MSYNVDTVTCLSGELTISAEGREWLEDNENDEGEEKWWPKSAPEVDGDRVKMDWSGQCSGNAVYYGALNRFFAYTRGTAEFVFTFEGGDSFVGYRVVDGVVSKHEVEFKLGKEIENKTFPDV